MVEYCGVGLVSPTPELAQFLADWWCPDRIRESHPTGFQAGGLSGLPTPYPAETRAPKHGVLHWPTGASRWAEFHHLVTGYQLTRIREYVEDSMTDGTKIPTLAISDGATSLSAPMKMLPARPICQTGRDELYLLTLVDVRWDWWNTGVLTLDFDIRQNWSTLFATLFGYLGITPTVDTIPAAYGTTSYRLGEWSASRPLPPCLDAVAAMVGCRIVRHLDGTVRVDRWDTAKANQDVLYLAADRHRMSGGRLSVEDIGRSVPEQVTVQFRGPPVDPVTHTLTSLALTEYGASAGQAGATGVVWVDRTDRDTATGLEAAKDFYRWQLSDVDAVYRGVVDWTPSGVEDSVDWSLVYEDEDQLRVATSVNRGPFQDANVYGELDYQNERFVQWQVTPIGGIPGTPEYPHGYTSASTSAQTFATIAEAGIFLLEVTGSARTTGARGWSLLPSDRHAIHRLFGTIAWTGSQISFRNVVPFNTSPTLFPVCESHAFELEPNSSTTEVTPEPAGAPWIRSSGFGNYHLRYLVVKNDRTSTQLTIAFSVSTYSDTPTPFDNAPPIQIQGVLPSWTLTRLERTWERNHLNLTGDWLKLASP